MIFTISGTNTEFLLAQSIEAKSKEEAIKKYRVLWEIGEIPVATSELKVENKL